jgi:hypothetical protein
MRDSGSGRERYATLKRVLHGQINVRKDTKFTLLAFRSPKYPLTVVEYSLISSGRFGRGLPWKSRRKTYKRAF